MNSRTSSLLIDLRSKFPIDWRQTDAIERRNQMKHLNLSNTNIRIFAFEDPKFKQGCRKFITTPLRQFYMWYRDCAANRHFYEIILENLPCRLYFDLEYYFAHNPDLADPIPIVRQFINETIALFGENFSIDLDADQNFLILDSSTSEKFSAHITVHLPDGKLFPNNVMFKQLVQLICTRLQSNDVCQIHTESGVKNFLCDLQVYTKNRNFRLFLSSKCGKNAVLQLAKYCKFYKKQPTNAQIFLDSLIIPKDFDKYQIVELSSVLPSPHTIKQMLQVPSKMTGNLSAQAPIMRSFANCQNGSIVPNSAAANDFVRDRSQNRTQSVTRELIRGSGASALPLLDQFMLTVFRKLKADAQIRIWCLTQLIVHHSEGECPESMGVENGKEKENEVVVIEDGGVFSTSYAFFMQYQLNNSRYCFNRGREHRSQNVYWMVDLQNLSYYQRCFDVVDCPGYSSQLFALPSEICTHVLENIGNVLETIKIPQERYQPNELALKRKRFMLQSESFNCSAEDQFFLSAVELDKSVHNEEIDILSPFKGDGLYKRTSGAFISFLLENIPADENNETENVRMNRDLAHDGSSNSNGINESNSHQNVYTSPSQKSIGT